MTQQHDSRQLFLSCLEKIRTLRGDSDVYRTFWDELEVLLNNYSLNNEWERMENDDVVIGEVWQQNIGTFSYKHTEHRFSCLYIESKGLAIKSHGHYEPANYGKQFRKVKELYVFPDGHVHVCRKDATHQLFNSFDGPIYVFSIKICSNGKI